MKTKNIFRLLLAFSFVFSVLLAAPAFPAYTEFGYMVFDNVTGKTKIMTAVMGQVGEMYYDNATGRTKIYLDPDKVGSGFDNIRTGTNTDATMTVGTGATFTYSGSGVINASQYQGITYISDTEFGYLNGLSDNIQDQLDAKIDDNPTEYDNGTCTTAKTISVLNGPRQKVTLTNGEECVLTFNQPASGTMTILIKIIQSSTADYDGTISTAATTKWPSAIIPTITATNGAIDIISCYCDGTNVYCVPSQDFR